MSATDDRTQHEVLAMPENHFDQVVTTGSVEPTRRATLRTKVIAVVLMPLFFIVTFSLCYLSALHHPQPQEMSLTVAGPSSTTQRIADSLADQADGAFAVDRTTDAAAARRAVADRSAAGAIVVEGDRVTSIVASGGGRSAATVVEQVGARVAGELGVDAEVSDVAPLTDGDVSGTVLFFLLVACTVGGFMTMTVVAQAMPGARTRTAIGVGAIASAVIPVTAFAVMSTLVGDYGKTFGDIAAVLGVGMLYTFAVSMISLLLNVFLRNGAIFGQILFLIALNFPSSGGSSPAPLLPGFWQGVHSVWFGAGAFEAIRSIIYFDGAGAGRWVLQVGIWAVAATALAVLTGLLRARRRRREVQPDVEPQPVAQQEALLSGASL